VTLTPAPQGLRRTEEIEKFRGGKVTLTIIKGSSLKAMDSSMFSKKGSSDPYVKILCRDNTTNKLEVLGKTKTVKKTLNPEWKSEHAFLLTDHHSSIITLTLWDHDSTSGDDPMGIVTLPLASFLSPEMGGEALTETFAPSGGKDMELEVMPCEGCDAPSGTVTVKLSFEQNEADPYEGLPFSGGVLVGVVRSAADLMVMDSAFIGKASSDPFVKITARKVLDGKTSEKQVHKTGESERELSQAERRREGAGADFTLHHLGARSIQVEEP
jgi:Ca2+-dependent lipid-binding protein